MLSPPTVWRFSVAADIHSNVFDFYFLIWSLSRLLCCVGSGFNVAATLGGGSSWCESAALCHQNPSQTSVVTTRLFPKPISTALTDAEFPDSDAVNIRKKWSRPRLVKRLRQADTASYEGLALLT